MENKNKQNMMTQRKKKKKKKTRRMGSCENYRPYRNNTLSNVEQ